MPSPRNYVKVEPWTRRRFQRTLRLTTVANPVGAGRFPPGVTHGIREHNARCDRRGCDPARGYRQLVCRRELGRGNPNHGDRPRGLRWGVDPAGRRVLYLRPALPNGQRPSPGHSPAVREPLAELLEL